MTFRRLVVNFGIAVSCCVMSSLLCSCAPAEKQPTFSVRMYGGKPELERSVPQRQQQKLGPLTSRTFREVTISQGSGATGFDSLRVFADGHGYAAVNKLGGIAEYLPLTLSRQEMKALLDALRRDDAQRLAAVYSAGMEDGTQGFVELVLTEGKVASWLDNYFVPVRHTFHFCNRYIWPKINSARGEAAERKQDSAQAEYHRVFSRASL